MIVPPLTVSSLSHPNFGERWIGEEVVDSHVGGMVEVEKAREGLDGQCEGSTEWLGFVGQSKMIGEGWCTVYTCRN